MARRKSPWHRNVIRAMSLAAKKRRRRGSTNSTRSKDYLEIVWAERFHQKLKRLRKSLQGLMRVRKKVGFRKIWDWQLPQGLKARTFS
jgi:hypothetical protein